MKTVYFDGACWPFNPGGQGSYAYVIYNENDKLTSHSANIGQGKGMTNNVAEYFGIYRALEYLFNNQFTNESIIVKGDSKLVIQQMKGDWKIKKGQYKVIAIQTQILVRAFKDISFFWIPREENEECDKLTKEKVLKKEDLSTKYYGSIFF